MPQTASVLRRYWPVILLALLPALPLWRCLAFGEAIGPFDQIRQMAPWNGPKPSQPWDVLQADGVLQFYPWRDMVFKAWSQGQLPLWNPYELAGTPLLANSQSAGLYPPHILVGLLHVPTAPAMVFLAWLHLVWAGLGVYVLARGLGASRLGAAVGASSFELSAFMLAWTALPSVIGTVAWIPWLLAGIRAIAGRPTLRAAALTAASGGMMILAGHLQFAAYGFMAAVLFGIVLAISARAWRNLVLMLLGLVFAGALAAPQLLPVMSFSQQSHRRNTPTPEGYRGYISGAMSPFELANLGVATSLGDPREQVVIAPGESISSYWPPLVKQGANFAESAMTLGPIVIALLFLVDYRDRRLWPLLAVGGVALLLALGTILNWPLYFLLPGWSSTGSPGRIIALFVLAACVLASCGIRAGAYSSRRYVVAIGASLLLSVVFAFAFPLIAPAQPTTSIMPLVAAKSAAGALISAVAVSLLALLPLVPGLERFRPGMVIGPALLAVSGYALTLVPTGSPIPVGARNGFDRVAIVNEPWSLHVAAPAYAPPNTGYLLGLHELGGYDSLIDRDTVAMLKDVDGQDPPPPANGNMMFVKPTADWFKLAAAGVSELLNAGPGKDLDYRELAPAGRAYVHGSEAKPVIVRETFSSLALEAIGPGLLEVKDRNMPGWLAKVDGRHVPIGGKIWREVELPPGKHRVEFNYVPPGLMPGIYLGTAAWIFLALAAFFVPPSKVK